ncbi:MAG: oxygen-independent coproporphyrinogen III oxidase [Candidatus Zixiibacteriota bacterium]
MSPIDTQNSAAITVDLLRKYDRPGPRYTSYPTAPVWSDQVNNEHYHRALEEASKQTDEPLALYCHIPFCQSRCLYCGCNTYITNRMSRADDYVAIMLGEVRAVASRMGKRRRVNQLHFGGGTPSFVGVEKLKEVLNALRNQFDFAHGCEISIEVDPRAISGEQVEQLINDGFNRVSVGVQDLDPKVQQAVGRSQPIERVQAVLDRCRTFGLSGINFDLIYGLPCQTALSFASTLDKVISMRPDRLAIYSFAYLPDRLAHQRKIDVDLLPSTEEKYRMLALTIEHLGAAGYVQIGMDHFALPEDELVIAQSTGNLHRNFMGYTVRTAPDMIGFGMSSIGYVNKSFFQNQSKLDAYSCAIDDHDFAVYRGMILSDDDLVRQDVIKSLMCNFAIDTDRINRRFGIDYYTYFADEHDRLNEFVDDRLIVQSRKGLTVTEFGRTFVRNIAMVFDSYLNGKQASNATFSRTI